MSELATAAPRGNQPERTVLSWQRTSLATATGAAVIARHTGDVLGPLTLLILLGTLALAVSTFILGRHRYAPAPLQPSRRRDGRTPFLLALAVFVMAITELVGLLLSPH